MIPSLWREELLHPFLAHFAVSLLPIALLFRVAALILRRHHAVTFLVPSFRTLLFLAVLVSWGAVFTGNFAEDIVNKVICDPTVTHEHQDWAEWTAYGTTFIFLLELSLWLWKKHIVLQIFSITMMVASLGCLMRTAHLGASLVYQQGAAVYHPSAECKEFE